MLKDLHRLLMSHEFLTRALHEHRSKLSQRDSVGLKSRIDRLFLDILQHASDDSRVTLAQVRFLLSNLVELVDEKEKAIVLRELCQHHLDRLVEHIKPQPAPPSLPPPSDDFRYLNSLSDRVAVIDAEYRYVFTNCANAAFHSMAAADFVGCPNWQIVGERYFERHNKARFDSCFAGGSRTIFSKHPQGDPTKIYSAKYEPVRNPDGSIYACLVTSREVSDLPIPAEFITPLS
jgi:hypothetical protein